MALHSHGGRINFADPANIRLVHEALMSQIGNKAINISNMYKIQIEPIQFEWDKFLPTLEKDSLEILNEELSHNNNQQQQPNSNENSSTPNKNRNQYNMVEDNRNRVLVLWQTYK